MRLENVLTDGQTNIQDYNVAGDWDLAIYFVYHTCHFFLRNMMSVPQFAAIFEGLF